MAHRTIEVVDAQLEQHVGTLTLFAAGRRGPTYGFSSAVPDLQDAPASTHLPPFLADCLPDSWGRHLIKRSLNLHRDPFPHELLLALSDEQRPGSLRFFEDGVALAPGEHIPPLVALGRIDTEVRKVTGDRTWRVSELIGIGSQSLGGARPKATVRDSNGDFWVAKFAAQHDTPRVEALLMSTAARTGITCARTRVVRVGNGDVLLSKRFDREGRAFRIGMRSYAAVLEINDAGEGADWADLIAASDPADASELWRRAAFGALVHNSDDHIRNHSQLRTSDGSGWAWRLSPAYDITHDADLDSPHALSIMGEIAPLARAQQLPHLAELSGLSPDEAKVWLSQTLHILDASGCPIHPVVAAHLAHWSATDDPGL